MRGQEQKKASNVCVTWASQKLKFLFRELQLNSVARWDLGSIVPGLLFPAAEKKKNDLWFSDYVFCQKAISIDILHLIQN